MTVAEIGTLIGILVSVLNVAYTYGILSHRVKSLEKSHDDKSEKDHARDAQITTMLVTLGRVEQKLDYIGGRKQWWQS